MCAPGDPASVPAASPYWSHCARSAAVTRTSAGAPATVHTTLQRSFSEPQAHSQIQELMCSEVLQTGQTWVWRVPPSFCFLQQASHFIFITDRALTAPFSTRPFSGRPFFFLSFTHVLSPDQVRGWLYGFCSLCGGLVFRPHFRRSKTIGKARDAGTTAGCISGGKAVLRHLGGHTSRYSRPAAGKHILVRPQIPHSCGATSACTPWLSKCSISRPRSAPFSASTPPPPAITFTIRSRSPPCSLSITTRARVTRLWSLVNNYGSSG